MTLFEYIAVAFSIVLSLAAVRLLGGLSVSFRPSRRYWPHSVWIVFALLNSAMLWWNFWSFLDVDWNIVFFFLVLVVPSLIYLQAAALVPENPGAVPSWHDYFFSARTRFFVALASFFLVMVVISWLLLGLPLTHPLRAVQAVAFVLALGGALSTNNRLHEALPIIFLVLLTIAAIGVFLHPGSLVPGG